MIRFARENDVNAIRMLWESCFPEEGGFNAYFFSHIYQSDYTLLKTTDNGDLLAMLQALPYRITDGIRENEVTYLYGVCTAPEYRRQGHITELLEYSFALDKQAGRVASVLIPQERWLFDFYRPFGYEPSFLVSQKQITLDRNIKPSIPYRLSIEDIPQMERLYTQTVSPCHILRDETIWRQQLSLFDILGTGVYGWFENGNLSAYAFCWADTIPEALGLTAPEEQGLLSVLKIEKAVYTSPGSETPLGCIKWYEKYPVETGYMNLMLN